MDDELRAAITELRSWAGRAGYPLDHLTDAGVLEGVQRCMARLPDATLQLVKDRGLERVATVLARLSGIANKTMQ